MAVHKVVFLFMKWKRSIWRLFSYNMFGSRGGWRYLWYLEYEWKL